MAWLEGWWIEMASGWDDVVGLAKEVTQEGTLGPEDSNCGQVILGLRETTVGYHRHTQKGSEDSSGMRLEPEKILCYRRKDI